MCDPSRAETGLIPVYQGKWAMWCSLWEHVVNSHRIEFNDWQGFFYSVTKNFSYACESRLKSNKNWLKMFMFPYIKWVRCNDNESQLLSISHIQSWIILVMGSANERGRYNATSSPIDWDHSQNYLWQCVGMCCVCFYFILSDYMIGCKCDL